MTTHTGFAIAAALSLLVTLPVMAWQWRTRRTDTTLAVALYVSGYLLIGAALALNPIVQPPLFVHGFVPGIGTGMIAVALAMGGRVPHGSRGLNAEAVNRHHASEVNHRPAVDSTSARERE